jgi:hypothetical protein
MRRELYGERVPTDFPRGRDGFGESAFGRQLEREMIAFCLYCIRGSWPWVRGYEDARMEVVDCCHTDDRVWRTKYLSRGDRSGRCFLAGFTCTILPAG